MISFPLTTDGSRAKYDYIRAGNYLPRNQYRDRFFDENGTHITIPGAIPKSQRSYTTAPLTSSTNQRNTHSSYPRAEDADLKEGQRLLESEDGVGTSGGDDRLDNYGRPPWEHTNWILGDLEGDEEATRKSTREGDNRDTRRSLQESGVEPAVESPLSCVSEGDSVLFDISSGCYPVYEKDSLLNSNLE